MGRRAKIKTSITVDPDLKEYADREAKRLGGLDFSSFVRMLIASDKAKKEKADGKER